MGAVELKKTEPRTNFHLDNLISMFTSFVRESHESDVSKDHLSDVCFTFEMLSNYLSKIPDEK